MTKGSQLLYRTIIFHFTQSFPKDFWPICIHAIANQKANGLSVVDVNRNCIYLKTVGLGSIDDKEDFSPKAGTAQELKKPAPHQQARIYSKINLP